MEEQEPAQLQNPGPEMQGVQGEQGGQQGERGRQQGDQQGVQGEQQGVQEAHLEGEALFLCLTCMYRSYVHVPFLWHRQGRPRHVACGRANQGPVSALGFLVSCIAMLGA